MDHLEALDNFHFSKLQSSISSIYTGLSTFYYTLNIHELISANLTNWSSIAMLWLTNCFNTSGAKKLTHCVTGEQIGNNAAFILQNYRSHRRSSLVFFPADCNLTTSFFWSCSQHKWDNLTLVVYISEMKKLISVWSLFLLCSLLSLLPLCLFAFGCLERVRFSFVIQICGRIVQQQKEPRVIGQ